MLRLAVSLLLAQFPPTSVAPDSMPVSPTSVPFANPIVFNATFAASGAAIPDDAGTIAHVTWNGSALVDSKGNAWTQNGTVPQVTTGPFFPGGFSGSAKPGAGAFSDTNYYSLGTGADIFDFAGDYSICIVFQQSNVTGDSVLLSDGTSGVDGFYVQSVLNTGTVQFTTSISGSTASAVTANVVVNGPNVWCGGRAANTMHSKLNLGTDATATASSTITPATTTSTKIGKYSAATHPWANGTAFEVWASTTTPTDALFTSIQQGVFGHIAQTGQALTVTRASTATTSIAGTEYTWPAGVLRIDSGGAIIEPTRTNAFLNSDAPATQTITFATGAEYTTAVGAGSMAIAVGTAVATGLPCTATAASPCSFNVTTGGTVVFTYTATLTFFQVENGAFPTSKIHTAGTAVARNSDVVTFTNPLTAADSSWCMSDTATDIVGNTWAGGVTAGLLAMGNLAVANTSQLFQSSGNLKPVVRVIDNAVASRDLEPAGAAPSTGAHRVVGCYQGIIQSLTLDTTTSTTVLSGAGTGVLSAMPATVTIGNLDGGTNIYLGGWHHRNVAISRSSDPGRMP